MLRELFSFPHCPSLMVMGLAMFATACTSGAEKSSLISSPAPAAIIQVEYVRVEGQACLQPQVISGVPAEHDFVVAEYRWLAKHHPGYRVKNQAHLLGLAPEYRQPEDRDASNGPSDQLEFQTSDGKLISECFELTVTKVDKNND